MNFKEVLETILNVSDIKVKNNPNFKAILDKLYYLINTNDSNYKIDVNDEIYGRLNNIKNVYKNSINDIIFSLEFINEETNKLIEFYLEKDSDNYIITLALEEGDNLIDEKVAEVTIKPDITIWKVGKTRSNLEGYYLDYKMDLFKYDKYNKLINEDFSDELDIDFSKFFNVPVKDSRKYRTNFKQYIEYVNRTKKIGCMNALDKLYCKDKILFGETFKYNELDGYFVDFEDDFLDEDIDDIDELDDIKNRSLSRLNFIKEIFKKNIGINGEFTISQNLIMNIVTYIESEDNTINTKGFIVKKLNNKFTLYYLYITNDYIKKLSKEISLEEAQELFKSHEFNENIYGLNEFFQINKDKRLSLD